MLETLLMQVNMVIDLEKSIKKMKTESLSQIAEKEFSNKIKRLNSEIEKLKLLKKVSYEDWKFEKITKEEFLNYSKDYDERIELLNKEIKVSENSYYDSIKNLKKDDYWIEHFKRNKKIKTLSKEVIDELIDVIYVHEGGKVTIKFKYQDEYERTLQFIKEKEESSRCINGKLQYT